jgi:cytochrome P450
MRGQLPEEIKRFHAEYGDIVRLVPDELSFTNTAAWTDIYPNNFLLPYEYKDQLSGKTVSNLIACTEEEHSHFKRILVPAFSEGYTAVREPFVRAHVDKLISKLNERIEKSEAVSL